MIMKGQKRKFPPEDVEEVSDRSSPTWESQREFVFSVSLSKYQRGQELPEPSLRRSVLIANTLRQISREACGVVPSADGPSPPSALQEKEREGGFGRHPASDQDLVGLAGSNCFLGSCPEDCRDFPPSDAPSPEEDEDWGSMSTDPDFSLSAAISSILTALDSTIDGGGGASQTGLVAVPRTPLRALENLSRPSEVGGAWAKPGVRGHGAGWEQAEGNNNNNVEVMRSSYLSDLTVEDLFQDIDTSLLERDMGVLGLRGSGGGYPGGEDLLRYLPPFSSSSSSSSSSPSSSPYPFSLSLSQKCLPSFSSFSPSSSPPFPSPPSSPFSGQNHTRDGLELDHLMEILVES